MLMLWAKAVAANEAKATRVEKTFIVRRCKRNENDVRSKESKAVAKEGRSAVSVVCIYRYTLIEAVFGDWPACTDVQADSIPTLR